MRPKYKVTGCARFFIFFLFFAPAVFFGAAYARGENGVQIIKDFIGGLTGRSDDNERAPRQDTKPADETSAALRKELDQLREENRALKEKVAEQQMELDKLRKAQQ
jgi:predicted RNase H-like nuclease (RuvC/YqgF family)